MAGLYIHIPFCRSKCAYCDFYSMPLPAHKKDNHNPDNEDIYNQYCNSLLTEFTLRRHEISEPFTTIYIGGGTPTAIPRESLLNLICRLSTLIPHPAEFTIEANPEDISAENIEDLRSRGITRISIGIQSFSDSQLQDIGRNHCAADSLRALDILRQSGINYSADLIYGLPDQTPESWRHQLRTLLQFHPPHFSAYLLSYEPGTRLHAMLQHGKVTEASEQTAIKMFAILRQEAADAGYNHYEISNFALPGHEARHNSSYWNLTPYLGLGCGAHSFDGTNRRYNPSNLRKYLQSLNPSDSSAPSNPSHQPQSSHSSHSSQSSHSSHSSHSSQSSHSSHSSHTSHSSHSSQSSHSPSLKAPAILDIEDDINRINDYIITSLRTSAGLSLSIIEQKWGRTLLNQLLSNAQPLLNRGLLLQTDQKINIPAENWLTSDAILREIIL